MTKTAGSFRDSLPPRSSLAFGGAIAIVTVFAAWMRTHGIAIQIVQDDEWHAIHTLMAAGYGEIVRTFGYADHSIPLTLFYKAMADSIGLDEVNMRAAQIACGIAVVPLAAFFAQRATRDPQACALYAALLAGAPFLVLYSRYARPYAITLLLVVVSAGAAWAWRDRRSMRLAAATAFAAALAAWLHPIAALYPVVAGIFVFLEDVAARKGSRAFQSFALGVVVALAMLVALALPLWSDIGALTAKAGADFPTLRTLARVISIFCGGLPDPVTAAIVALAAYGALRLARADARLAAYLAALAIVPATFVFIVGAKWAFQAHTFARYVMPAQAILLFWAACGAMGLVRAIVERPGARWTIAAALALAYVAANPALSQVVRLREWYGHLYHHYDYADSRNVAVRQYDGFQPPDFYRKLGAMPEASAPIIEAPFTYEAPANVFAFFALFHRQPEKMGMLHDLCLDGPYVGEVPPDRRFRFRQFVFLDDPRSVRASGARYLLLYRRELHGRPFVEWDRCLARLSALYGPPSDVAPRLAVWELGPGAAGKLQ